MAWTSPRSWVAGAVVTAAQLNAHLRDNLAALLPLDAVAFTSYTPTLTQSGSVTKTVTRAKYQQIGKIVTVSVFLDVTGAGSANNKVTVSLPVTAAAATSGVLPVGSGWIKDTSANLYYPQVVLLDTTTTAAFLDSTAATVVYAGQTGSAFALALANTDQIGMVITYEAA